MPKPDTEQRSESTLRRAVKVTSRKRIEGRERGGGGGETTSMLHEHAARACCTSMLHEHAAQACCTSMLHGQTNPPAGTSTDEKEHEHASGRLARGNGCQPGCSMPHPHL